MLKGRGPDAAVLRGGEHVTPGELVQREEARFQVLSSCGFGSSVSEDPSLPAVGGLVHSDPQKVTFFGLRVFAAVIKGRISR